MHGPQSCLIDQKANYWVMVDLVNFDDGMVTIMPACNLLHPVNHVICEVHSAAVTAADELV